MYNFVGEWEENVLKFGEVVFNYYSNFIRMDIVFYIVFY